jgi:putative hydrolase of the HAD superfamily
MAEVIKALFLDIGGVLLTSGWDRNARRQAITSFKLDQEETEERHHLTFDLYEAGMLTMDEYLDRIVFYRERDFSKEEFKTFMFKQSGAIEGSIAFFKSLKRKHALKVFAVNNEARELNEFRIRKYELDQLFDAFISSCNVHLRKPDIEIFNMACDIAHIPPSNILYIDDRLLFVDVAKSLGINGYHFQGLDAAKLFMQTIRFA